MFERAKSLLRQLSGANTATDDRRRHERFDTNIETFIRPVTTNEPIAAKIRNASRSGLNLLVPCCVPEGTMIRIELPTNPGELHTTVLACVMHARELPDEQWSLGCMFSLELEAGEMKAFGAEKKKAGPGEQRAWVRFPVRGSCEYRILPGDMLPAMTGEIANISPGGIGLILNQPIEPGVVLNVNLKRQGQSSDLSMLACIVYLAETDNNRYAVGCNFIRDLTDKEFNGLAIDAF